MLEIYAYLPRNKRWFCVLKRTDRRIARRVVRQLRRLGRPAYFRARK